MNRNNRTCMIVGHNLLRCLPEIVGLRKDWAVQSKAQGIAIPLPTA